jgi:heptosyltransferase-3
MIIRKALFIQLKMLGDILMLTPAIKAFKRKYPDCELDVAVESPGEILLQHNPYIDNLIKVPKTNRYNLLKQLQFVRSVRRKQYDMAIDFLGNPRSAHYTFLSGAKTRVGYSDARFTYAYNRTSHRDSGYSALSKLNYIAFLGIDTSDYMPEFHLDQEIEPPNEIKALAEGKLVAISPVSLREHKVWPTANFAEVAKHLAEKYGYHPVVIVGPREKRFLDEFARYSKVTYTPLYIDDLMRLGAALKACRLFVGNDNGPKHFAVALGLPTFTVYSHLINPASWNYPDPTRHRFIGGSVGRQVLPLKEIPVAKMIAPLDEFIDQLD